MLSDHSHVDFSWFESTVSIKKRYRLCGTEHYMIHHALKYGQTESCGLPIRKFFDVTQDIDNNDIYEIFGSHLMNPGVQTGVKSIEDEFKITLPKSMHEFYRRWGGGFLLLGEYHYLLSPAESIAVSKARMESHGYKKGKGCLVLYLCDLGQGNSIVYFRKGSEWKITYFHLEIDHEQYYKDFEKLPSLASSFYLWLYNTIAQDGSLPFVPLKFRPTNPMAPRFERLPLLGYDD